MQLDVKGAAAIFDVSEKTIHRWIKQGKLPACRINGQYRFNRAELLEWATSHEIPVSAEMAHETETGDWSAPDLHGAIGDGGIHYGVKGTDKASVLRSVVDLMHLPQEADRDFLYKVLLARESLGSTAIGDGVAIPHVRNPIVLHISRPAITLCFLEHPMDFGALDGLPVGVLFTIVSPTVRDHLHLLSELAFALKDPGFKSVIARAGAPGEILAEVLRLEETIHKSTGISDA